MGVDVGVGVVTLFSMPVAVSLFGVVAIVFISHALFVKGPVDEVAELADEVEPEKLPGVTLVARISE